MNDIEPGIYGRFIIAIQLESGKPVIQFKDQTKEGLFHAGDWQYLSSDELRESARFLDWLADTIDRKEGDAR